MFNRFLMHVGPRPCPGATLDRIDNADPEYAPRKVRWADKRTQNSNKGDSLLFYYSRTGDTYTVSRLAKLRKVSPSTIRKRKERGWTDDEIVEGKRHVAPVDIEHSPRASVRRDRKHYYSQPEPPPPETPFQRNAKYAVWHRETYGEEYCLADFETLSEDGVRLEGYDRFFTRWWATWKPHLKWQRLPEWAQELTAKIDGTTVAEIKSLRDKMQDWF